MAISKKATAAISALHEIKNKAIKSKAIKDTMMHNVSKLAQPVAWK